MFRSMLYYIGEYPEQLHHPKEERCRRCARWSKHTRRFPQITGVWKKR